jgi:hypothetical protein
MLFASITKSAKLFNVQQPSVSAVINNSNSSSGPGWFSSAISGIRAFAEAHPYITYAVVGAAAGAVVYFTGVAFIGRTAESSLSDSASTPVLSKVMQICMLRWKQPVTL